MTHPLVWRSTLLPLLLISIASCSSFSKKTGATKELTLIATSDFHSSFERAEGLAIVIRDLRSRLGENTIHLDGGDLFQGSLEGNLSKGRAPVEFYNSLRVDAAAIGNHELDYGTTAPDRSSVRPGEDGLGNLKARGQEARFAWLSANFIKSTGSCDPRKTVLCNANGQPTLFAPHVVLKRGDVTACVIGATTPTTPTITNPHFLKGMRFETLESTIPAEVDFLKRTENCDFTILVAHAGLSCSTSNGRCLEETPRSEILYLLRAFPDRLDAVIAGHTHLRAQEIIGGTPVLEPGSHARQVGILRITSRGSDGKPARAPVFDGWSAVDENATDPATAKLMAPYRKTADALRSEVLGEITAPFPHSYEMEGPLGNLVVDSILAGGKKIGIADFAITNPGGIRTTWRKAGALTYDEVFRAVPFDNALAVVELTGEELTRLIEISFSIRAGITPVAGLKIERIAVPPAEQGPWDRDLDGDGKMETWERNLVLKITDSKGRKLSPRKTYRVATIDFLVNGAEYHGKVYSKVPPSRIHIYPDVFMRELVVKEVRRRKKLRPSDYFDAANPRVITRPTQDYPKK